MLQWQVWRTAAMGLLPNAKPKATTTFIDSRPDRFVIFFPCDWHIAKVVTDEDDQTIRVIVIKLDYVE